MVPLVLLTALSGSYNRESSSVSGLLVSQKILEGNV